jgi:N-acetylglucosamine-6-phosphate deacetylase
MSPYALVGARVLQGNRIVDGRAIVVADGRISAVPSVAELPPGLERRSVAGTLVPGFVDVQVNGGGGVLFNDRPSVEGIRAIGAAHRRFGTTGFLPTLISDTRETMAAAVAAVRAGLEAGVPGLLGIHLEGPFFNPARKGVHDPKFIRPIEAEDLRIMTSLGAGRTLVTLAPEMVPIEAIARLSEAGVIVSAGHTEASFETLEAARRNGLAGYTHLYNAMPPLAGRAPGPVGAALSDADAFASIIVDLRHVSVPAIRVALAAKRERLLLVTDAMPTVGTDVERFDLQGRTILRRGGVLTTADGTLAGSDLDMATAVRNLVRTIGVPPPDAFRCAAEVPAAFLRLEGEIGRIAPGFRASMALLDDDLIVRRTWIDGAEAVG